MTRAPLQPAWPVRVCLTAALLAAAGCPERKKGPETVAVVATVHGAPITADQFATELAFVRRTSAGVLPQTDEEVVAFRRATLEDLIDLTLLLDAAHDAGVTVTSDKVDREVLRLKADYHGPGFNEALTEGGLSQQELKERTRARLIVERYFVDEIFARVAVTDPEIDAYYKDHAEDFAQPEQVRAAQIVVKSAEEARRILYKIRGEGMSFDEAARRWSLSPDAKVGGDLGFFKKGVMPAIFDQTCFALQKSQVSEVVASEYGFHLFKVLDRKPAEPLPLSRVRGEVEKLLWQKKREAAQQRALLELRAGPGAAGCKDAKDDAGLPGDNAVLSCLKQEGQARIKINVAVLAQVQL
ncbi:MAG TPA: peptidyl-prolyl cis-trans isomerase [Myxococcales bacterium]|jgi:peptidyl-prolyl cis-trans isomerase C/foldase protein PrsA